MGIGLGLGVGLQTLSLTLTTDFALLFELKVINNDDTWVTECGCMRLFAEGWK